MKRSLTSAAFALGAAALLGLAAAGARADGGAAPLPLGPGPLTSSVTVPAASPAAPGAPAPAPTVIVSDPPAGCCAAGACEAPCLKKVCIPSPATRVVERRKYGETCEDFCLPKCSLGGGLLSRHKDSCDACPTEGCDGGSCGTCENHVRTRKYLVVKVKHEEETYTQCTPGYAPAEEKCRAPLFGHKKACADGGCLPPADGVVVTSPALMPPADGARPAEKVSAPKEK